MTGVGLSSINSGNKTEILGNEVPGKICKKKVALNCHCGNSTQLFNRWIGVRRRTAFPADACREGHLSVLCQCGPQGVVGGGNVPEQQMAVGLQSRGAAGGGVVRGDLGVKGPAAGAVGEQAGDLEPRRLNDVLVQHFFQV